MTCRISQYCMYVHLSVNRVVRRMYMLNSYSILSHHVIHHTHRRVAHPNMGIDFTFVDFTKSGALEAAITPQTKVCGLFMRGSIVAMRDMRCIVCHARMLQGNPYSSVYRCTCCSYSSSCFISPSHVQMIWVETDSKRDSSSEQA